MEKDNEETLKIIRELRECTNDYELPPSSCSTFESTYDKLQDLERDLNKHIEIESNILFHRLKNEK